MKFLTDLTLEHFEQMHALEALYYPEEYIAPADEAYRWYLRYPYTTTALFLDGKLVGFINLFPVKPEIFEALRRGVLNDSTLTVEGIEDLQQPMGLPMQLFLSCIAVHPDYRGSRFGVSKQLLQEALEQYRAYGENIQWVITDNVTPEGERFSQRHGFMRLKESDHDSVLYLRAYRAFLEE